MLQQQNQFNWRSQKVAFEESLEYMKGRMDGSITSIITPWKKFNDATVNGLEWNSINLIAARPGSGKTLIAEQICKEAHVLNPTTKFRILKFQFEMLGRVQAMREYSSVLGKSYKYLANAESIGLSEADFNLCVQHARNQQDYMDIVDTPLTPSGILQTVEKYCNLYKDDKVLITLDHTVLVKKSPYQREVSDMLYELGEVLTRSKKEFPICWLILSQLNRNVDDPRRAENGTIGNYINDSDIFGADAMLQHADTLIGINRPGKRNITYYGPDRYIIADDKTLVFHFLKNRAGDTRISFFEAEFEKMRIKEMSTPACNKIKI